MRYILIFTILLASCSRAKKTDNENSITKIEFATGECYGDCTQIAINLDSDLIFNYYGGKNAKLKGFYSGNISEPVWDTLNRKLEAIHNKGQTDGMGIMDDEEVELIIYYHHKSIHINSTLNSLPDSTRKVIEWLKKSINYVKLNPAKDSIKFGTIFQYEKPPIPSIKQVKFPPPRKENE